MGNEFLLPLSAAGGFALTAALFAFVYYRGLALLQFYQQEEYNTERFLVWVIKKRAFDKRATLIILVSYILWYFVKDLGSPWINPIFYILVFLALVQGSFASNAARRAAKKPLVLTQRAQRIQFVYMLLTAAYFASIFAQQTQINITLLTLSFLAFFQSPPLFIGAANFILKPLEESINNRHLKQAKAKLSKFGPMIIAVTGSYGKTSTKHILGHILSTSKPALVTPGSVNTLLGVSRVINENLKESHKYLVVEMGAYGPGSIKQLCKLTPPNLGIITAVGVAHFERFKTVERVFKSKFELANDLASRGEKTILNATAIPEDLLAPYLTQNKNLILCGEKKSEFNLDFRLKKAGQDAGGIKLALEAKIDGKTREMEFQASLYGYHNSINVMMAVVAAIELGIPYEIIRAALKTVPQIPHRLEVTPGVKGPTIIDDAYNSNPTGFESALKVLSDLRKEGGRTILVTPGMVELGSKHDSQHKRLGELAGEVVDLALVVGPERIPTFLTAFNSTKQKGAQLRTFDSQQDAEHWVKQNATNKDVILLENNLPDLYESVIDF